MKYVTIRSSILGDAKKILEEAGFPIVEVTRESEYANAQIQLTDGIVVLVKTNEYKLLQKNNDKRTFKTIKISKELKDLIPAIEKLIK